MYAHPAAGVWERWDLGALAQVRITPQALLATGLLAHALFQITDAALTTVLLQNGGIEGNPFIAAVIGRYGFGGFLTVKAAAAALFVAMVPWTRRSSRRELAWELALVGLSCRFMLWVVLFNGLMVGYHLV